MSQETQPIRIETGEEVAFEPMKFIAEKENKNPGPDEARDYYLGPFYRMCPRGLQRRTAWARGIANGE